MYDIFTVFFFLISLLQLSRVLMKVWALRDLVENPLTCRRYGTSFRCNFLVVLGLSNII